MTVEVASPALIEKVRTAVTDGSGQYQIVNLPPGTYIVTFTLTGFSAVRREGVDVSVAVTAQVNAEMKVGAVAETITVTGEAPVVDLQSTAQTRSATAQAFKELPTGGSWVKMAALIPAVPRRTPTSAACSGDQTGTQVSVHGGLAGDGVSMIDGMRIGNMYLSSNLTNMSLSPLLYDEVNISFSGQIAGVGHQRRADERDPEVGRQPVPRVVPGQRIVARPPGQQRDRSAQGAGACRPPRDTLKKLYDINGAIGGPIKQDKLWFYFTSRYFTNEYYMAGQYYPVDPSPRSRGRPI